MSDIITNGLVIWTGAIFLVWAILLVWASWNLCRIARSLAEERREVRRWRYLVELRDRQNFNRD